MRMIRFIKIFLKDFLDGVTGKRGPLIPPTRYMFHGTNTIEDFRRKEKNTLSFI